MDRPELLSARQLSKTFRDGTHAVRELDLILEEGSFTVLAGANGSGKTVLLKMLGGLLSPQEGDLLFRGKPFKEWKDRLFTKIGFIFQNPDSQIVGETVLEDIAFGPRNLGLSEQEISQRSKTALEKTGLTDMAHKRPHLLSGGEKRRLAIAGVDAMEPELLLLDEPFTNLDYQGSRELLALLEAFHREGKTILLVSHDLHKCIAHADRLVLMHRGRIVDDGSPAAVLPSLEAHGVRCPGEANEITRYSWLR